MSVIGPKFKRVYVLDFEFQAEDGERQKPVSLCALHYSRPDSRTPFKREADVKMFFRDGQQYECPFIGIESEETLFLGYNVSAEYKCHLVLGWPLPANTIDLMVEFKNETCGLFRGKDELWTLGFGLEDAVREMGENPAKYWLMPKEEMRSYIRRFGTVAPKGFVGVERDKKGLLVYRDVNGKLQPYSDNDPFIQEWITCVLSQEEHEELILRYNMEDCHATHFVAKAIMTNGKAYDEEQALNRGRFMCSTAHFEDQGIPINVGRFNTIRANARKLQVHIATEIEKAHNYGVYVIEGKEHLKNKPHAVFKMKNFLALLESHGITVGKKGAMWQMNDDGSAYLEDDYFGEMCNVYPWLTPLRQTKKTIRTLGLFNTVIGRDGMNRYGLFPFGQRTSRNNPGASEFMLGRPHWMRMLITPKPGYAIVSADVSGAEDWLAAGYSGDEKLMDIYNGGKDSYMEFAGVTGAVPPGTKRDKSNRELEQIRAQHKVAKLAIQYGVQENTLSKQLGVPVWRAGRILNSHREAYSVYWRWVQDQGIIAENRGFVATDYGWRQSTSHMNERQVLNFPQQAGCAELLRNACCLLLDEGWGYTFAAPHHDAVYMHVPVEKANELAYMLEQAFIFAGKKLMESRRDADFAENFPLRIKAKITPSPEHYVDDDGADIWRIVCGYFGWDEHTKQQLEETNYVAIAS